MKNVRSECAVTFTFALIASVLLPAGIVALIMGALRGETAIMVMGIVTVAVTFYSIPLLWMTYGGKVGLRRVQGAIISGYLTVTAIVRVTGIQRETVVERIRKLQLKQYIIYPYLIDDEYLRLTDGEYPHEMDGMTRCGYCNSAIFPQKEGYKCPYCGAEVKNEV